MQKPLYQDPFLSYDKQISLLKSRGLLFNDESQALNLLKRVSYYRLSSYFLPFQSSIQNKIFVNNVDFDDVFNLYQFDADLREIVMTGTREIEIAVRSKMVYTLSLSNGSFWLEQKDLFSDFKEYTNTISKIIMEIDRSQESFIVSFRNGYSNSTPPAFMVFETTSFGTLSRIYKHLKLDTNKREIAHFFGLPSVVFESWLHSLVYIRNICAHHARLWNREIRIKPNLPIKISKNTWLSNKQVRRDRIYIILSMIIYLLNAIDPKHTFKQKLIDLFSKYPHINKNAMGFPQNWQKEVLWCSR